MWVADGFADRLARVDPSTSKVTLRVPDLHARRLALGAGALWATDDLAGVVRRIDPKTGGVNATVALPAASGPIGIAADATGVWVADAARDVVLRIDPATGLPAGREVALRSSPLEVASGGGRVWITSPAADTVYVVDPASGTLVATVPVCDEPMSIVANETGAWVACRQGGEIWHLGRDGAADAKVPVNGRPAGLALGDGVVWVTIRGD